MAMQYLRRDGRYTSNPTLTKPVGADLVVLCLLDQALNYSPGAVSFGGDALQLDKSQDDGGSRTWSKIYSLRNPKSGANTLSVGSFPRSAWVHWFSGVLASGTYVYHTHGVGALALGARTTTVSTEKAGDALVYASIKNDGNGVWSNITLGASTTWNTTGVSDGAAYEIEDVAGSETATYGTGVGSRISIAGVSYKQELSKTAMGMVGVF